MRNSPLVEGSCAENVTGLKFAAEAVDVQVQEGKFHSGDRNQRRDLFAGKTGGESQWRGAGTLGQCLGMVGERSSGREGES